MKGIYYILMLILTLNLTVTSSVAENAVGVGDDGGSILTEQDEDSLTSKPMECTTSDDLLINEFLTTETGSDETPDTGYSVSAYVIVITTLFVLASAFFGIYCVCLKYYGNRDLALAFDGSNDAGTADTRSGASGRTKEAAIALSASTSSAPASKPGELKSMDERKVSTDTDDSRRDETESLLQRKGESAASNTL